MPQDNVPSPKKFIHDVDCGESMENALRACCKGIKIGKILINGEGNDGRQLIYEKLPADIASRHVLLLDPVLASGNSAAKPISLLVSKGVPESNIIFLNLISAPEGINIVCKKFPTIKMITSEIDASLSKDSRVVKPLFVKDSLFITHGSKISRASKASMATVAVDENEMEMLLEAYFMQID